MRRFLLTSAAAVTAAVALAPAALGGGPAMTLGAAEDTLRSPDLVTARIKMAVFRLAGFGAVRITSQWRPGQLAPTPGELQVLQSVAEAGRLTGVRIFVSVYSPGSATTPLTPEAQAQFAQYAAAVVQASPSLDDVIVGNEPNLNRFWLPQFNPDGSNAASPAYLALLAQAYDAIKAVDPGVRVWGGALAPRGSDRPEGARHTHSPTVFIQDMGKAYRASGRQLPVMDGFAFHPYADNSSQPPSFAHPKSTTIGVADYDKLVALLGEAFDGTAQPGSTLPILYDEFGVESLVPAGKAQHYTGTEPATTKPVDETTQAAYYQLALQLAFCQPNVAGMLLFHSHDETALLSWQSGVYYADGTPKASLPFVRDALDRVRGGSVTRCDGLALDVRALQLRFPTAAEFRRGKRDVRLRCSLDCVWELRAVTVADARTVAARRGYGRAGVTVLPSLKSSKLGAGTYRLSVTLTHPVNPGLPFTRESAPLTLP